MYLVDIYFIVHLWIWRGFDLLRIILENFHLLSGWKYPQTQKKTQTMGIYMENFTHSFKNMRWKCDLLKANILSKLPKDLWSNKIHNKYSIDRINVRPQMSKYLLIIFFSSPSTHLSLFSYSFIHRFCLLKTQ